MNTQPRRKWHLQRWLLLLAASLLAYAGWTQYAFRSAIKEARALGWEVRYSEPSERILKNWKTAFEKETWLYEVSYVTIPLDTPFEQDIDLIHRLNPTSLEINDAPTLPDLSEIKGLSRLFSLRIANGINLTNVDELKKFTRLEILTLRRCTELTNLDALKELTALKLVVLTDCKGLILNIIIKVTS